MCEKCNDTGWVDYTEVIDGIEYDFTKRCECAIAEDNRKRQETHIRKSGLAEVLEKMTFDTYQMPTKSHEALIRGAKSVMVSNEWWFLSGRSGTGKTHITTAICGEYIKRGTPVHYFQWRKDATEMKALVNNYQEYKSRLDRLINVDVLYIDDLFKGHITEPDKSLAFAIIDSRYKKDKKTMFTTELSLEEITKIDEAIGGRIKEKAGNYVIDLRKMENWRLK